MILLPLLIGLVGLDCYVEVITCLFEVEEGDVISIGERQTQVVISLCTDPGLRVLMSEETTETTYSATLQATIHLLTFPLLTSSSSPSTGLELKLTPPL